MDRLLNAFLSPNMMQNETDNIRIAITSDSILHRNYLQKTMEHSGIQVVLNESLTEKFMNKLDLIESDLVLFDVESIKDEHLDYLDQLLEQSRIPVIINDVSALTLNEPKVTSKWNSNLLQKIANVTGRNNWDDNLSGIDIDKNIRPATINKNKLAKNVWVLGASLGGPDALKQFLIHIPEELPVAFVVAQHLGENFVSILAEQLDRYTEFNVFVAREGHVVRHNEVLITPTNKSIIINSLGAVELIDTTKLTNYAPSINFAINNIASRYKSNAGAIIFSGMCDDGVEGCEALIEKGGQVWVQDSKSCVISAMPESVVKKVPVSYTGTPKLLAEQLVSFYKHKH